MTRTPLRYVLAGCGNIAARHARAIQSTDSARLVAACDIDPARARAFSEEHGVLAWDLADALRRQDIDAVLVTAPAPAHGEIALAALESGKHVLVEKPIDVDLRVADRMVSSARRRGLKLSVVAQNRFFPDVSWARAAIAAGAIGRPVLASVSSLWRRDQAYYDAAPGRGRHDPREGGVLLNQTVHAIDLMLWLLGPARKVQTRRARLTHEMAAEDTAVASIEFASGALGALVASTSIFDQRPDRFEIHGETGAIVLEGGRCVHFAFAEGAVSAEPPSRSAPEGEDDRLAPFRRQHEDFAAAIVEDREPTVTPEQAREVLAFALAAEPADGAGSAENPEMAAR